MPEDRKIYVRYTGDGAFFIGVPAKDLTKEEFDGLGPLEKRDVLAGTIYEPVARDAKSEKKAQAEREESVAESTDVLDEVVLESESE